jgi:hypothetical protein
MDKDLTLPKKYLQITKGQQKYIDIIKKIFIICSKDNKYNYNKITQSDILDNIINKNIDICDMYEDIIQSYYWKLDNINIAIERLYYIIIS